MASTNVKTFITRDEHGRKILIEESFNDGTNVVSTKTHITRDDRGRKVQVEITEDRN